MSTVLAVFSVWLIALLYALHQLRVYSKKLDDHAAFRYNITNSKVAVDQDYYWQPMNTCPRGVKVQLLSIGAVAVYGHYHGEPDWQGWAPVPKRKPN